MRDLRKKSMSYNDNNRRESSVFGIPLSSSPAKPINFKDLKGNEVNKNAMASFIDKKLNESQESQGPAKTLERTVFKMFDNGFAQSQQPAPR